MKKRKYNNENENKQNDNNPQNYDGDEEDDEDDDEQDDNDKYKNNKLDGLIFPLFFGPSSMKRDNNNNKKEPNIIDKIKKANIPEKTKEIVLNKLENSDIDNSKYIEWANSILSIPFGKYIPTPIKTSDDKLIIKDFFYNTIKKLDKQVYGLQNVKQEIINYLAQFITTADTSKPRVFALCGNPGVGKTHIIRTALSDALNRPIKCINMGGIRDSSYFMGFDFTYSGSKHGILIQTLIETQTMNPIICFEEVDKISETKEGWDIQNVLIHLTDPEQNHAIQDKYFSGIDIDFSKALFVFTLNNPELVHPILLNRLHIINIPDPSTKDKINITKSYIIPEICKNIGFDINLISISDDSIQYIINKYNNDDKGLRTLKHNIETILLNLNTINLIGEDISGKLKIKFPLKIENELIDKLLYSNKTKRNHTLESLYM